MTTPADFSEWLHGHLQISTDQSTIDLIPAPCGVGKSYSMTYEISEALRNYDGGIILVTDELERLHSYVGSSSGDSYLSEYIQRNRNRILVYEARNAKADRHKLFQIPIILMSTQRFFSLSREDVISLTQTYIPRRHVFIDERAPLAETIRIDLGTFNDIDTALNQCLDNTAAEKSWLVDQWRNLRQRYDAYMKGYESSHDDYELQLWHMDGDHHATTDDARFLHLVNHTYSAKLKRVDNEILKKIKAVFQMVNTDGALFISRRKPSSKAKAEYSKFFLVTLDNSDLLLDIGSKSVILDGTGDLDPVYDAWYINRVNCDQFRRDLSKLTINIVDANTSRNAIAKAPDVNKNLRAIIDHVKTIPKVDVVFTYGRGKEIKAATTVERVFHEAGFNTGHLGGLKGTNRFRHMTDFVQVGLNRIPDEYYLAIAIHNASHRYPPDKRHAVLMNFKTAAKWIMLRSILADVEQNIYRGVIRNVNNDQRETYTLIYKCSPKLDTDGKDHNELSELTAMIKERYASMGATVNVLDAPMEIKRMKTMQRKAKDGQMTNAQRVIEYISTVPAGEHLCAGDILKRCDLSPEDWKNAKKNKTIKQWLTEHKTEGGRYYVA